MIKDWAKLADDFGPAVLALRKGIPEVMKAFGQMDAAVSKDGALSPKTKELIALALGVAARCEGCIAFHARACLKYGASRDEVAEMLGMAVYMGGGPSVMYASQALTAFDQFSGLAKAA